MTKEHTPTPWKQHGLEVWATKPTRFNLVSAGTPRICLVDDHHSESGFEQANAAHIVKCVNMHDELVEALLALRSDCQSPIDMYERNGPEFTSPNGNEYESSSYVMDKFAEMVASINETLKKAGAL